VKKELKKLKMMHPMSAEATVVRNYIDWILGAPLGEYKTEEQGGHRRSRADPGRGPLRAQKVKERIVEYLAVQTLTREAHGSRSSASWAPRA
jgi:ATP-dependent Lon protease